MKSVQPPASLRGNNKATRLCERIRGEVENGTYKPGALLPPETSLEKVYDASRLTIRRALKFLEEMGYLERIPHRGVMVAADWGGAAAPGGPRQQGRATVIGAVLPAKPDEGLIRIQEGIEAYAREHGLILRYFNLPEGAGHAWMDVERAEALGVQGLVVLPYPGEPETGLLLKLRERGIHIACVEKRDPASPLASVEPDSEAGMYRAVQHLLQKHRRPVHYLGMKCEHKTDSDRYAGYVSAMRDAGFHKEVEACTLFSETGSADPRYWLEERKWFHGFEIAQKLLRKAKPPLSVACVKDDVAWGLYLAVEKTKLKVGRDVFVTGFDDLTIAGFLDPPLSTVRQGMREKGYEAARLLQAQIAARSPQSVTVRMPVELVVRGSS